MFFRFVEFQIAMAIPIRHYGVRVCMKAAVWSCVIAAFTALLFHAGAYNFCYAENWCSFYFNRSYLMDRISRIGGVSMLFNDFVTSFFLSPVLGCMIYAALLALISALMLRFTRRMTDSYVLLPIAMLPSILIASLSYDVNYSFSGTTSVLMILVAANVVMGLKNHNARWIFCSIVSVILYFLAGPISIVLASIVLLAELRDHSRHIVFFMIPVVSVVFSAVLCVVSGLEGCLKHALTPQAYYLAQLSCPWEYWLIWASILVVVAWVGFLSHRQSSTNRPILTMGMTLLPLVIGILSFSLIPRTNEALKEMSYSAYCEDWDALLRLPKKKISTNLLYQNYVGIALAKTDMMGDLLFSYPFSSMSSLCVSVVDKNPHIYSVVSDVYFSMGHMALARQHAFEANECVGNWSPRMLRRLIETNMAFGDTKVADKYLGLLSQTLFHRKWAKDYRKSRCVAVNIPKGGTLIGLEPIDKDLAAIVEANPEYTPAFQYLAALCLLNGNVPLFMEYLGRFYGTQSVPAKLPDSYQEAVALASNGLESVLMRYGIEDRILKNFIEFSQDPSKVKNSYWHYLR